MSRVRLFVAATATCTLLVAGCSSSAATPSPAATAAPIAGSSVAPTSATAAGGSGATGKFGSIGAASATGLTVSLAKGPQGIFVIGPNGHALYIFASDRGATSACTSAACVATWPALTASGPITAGPNVSLSELTTVAGQVPNQVTDYGHLLYYYAGDTAPGQTNGTSIPGWDLLGPSGNVMVTPTK